jgi:AdoMet-dependent rRNA methyltransferase SPB1
VSRWFSGNKLFDGVDDKESLVMPDMPKTDKQIRREKRKAAKDRQERRTLKKQKKEEKEYELEFGTEFDVAAAAHNSDDDAGMSDEEELEDEKTKEKKALIKSGMGAVLKGDASGSSAFEVVAASAEDAIAEADADSDDGEEALLPRMDDRKYDSDHEDYDPEDRARTLALASMMVKRSKAKDVIDASYNRYAWNDANDLPDWFADDEEKHYRPQIPIPKHIVEQMKERFIEMASKPVKKVAEARARKNRQQMKKLKAAKKKATDIANLPDMSTREKVKAIEKAMKGAKTKKENKVYVVSRRGGRSSTAQSAGKKASGKVKLVDPRMKKDKRNADKRAKRGKKAKR